MVNSTVISFQSPRIMPASTTSSDTKESNTRESSSTDPTTESGQGSSVPDSLDHIQWDLYTAPFPSLLEQAFRS